MAEGLIDPWHALSVVENVSQSELAIVIPGASHCADMKDDDPSDPPALTEARKVFGSCSMFVIHFFYHKIDS